MHASAGDLPLPVVRLLSSMRYQVNFLDLIESGPGFTLPANIGDLDPDITELHLRDCNLIGTVYFVVLIFVIFLSVPSLMREQFFTRYW